MLKQSVLLGIAAAKVAVADLAFDALIVKRSVTYVPGSAPSSVETTYAVKVVPTRYETKEIDGDRILASDWKWIVFPEDGQDVPEPNDIVRVTESGQFPAGDYRIMYNDKIFAGNELALSQLQIRLQ